MGLWAVRILTIIVVTSGAWLDESKAQLRAEPDYVSFGAKLIECWDSRSHRCEVYMGEFSKLDSAQISGVSLRGDLANSSSIEESVGVLGTLLLKVQNSDPIESSDYFIEELRLVLDELVGLRDSRFGGSSDQKPKVISVLVDFLFMAAIYGHETKSSVFHLITLSELDADVAESLKKSIRYRLHLPIEEADILVNLEFPTESFFKVNAVSFVRHNQLELDINMFRVHGLRDFSRFLMDIPVLGDWFIKKLQKKTTKVWLDENNKFLGRKKVYQTLQGVSELRTFNEALARQNHGQTAASEGLREIGEWASGILEYFDSDHFDNDGGGPRRKDETSASECRDLLGAMQPLPSPGQ